VLAKKEVEDDKHTNNERGSLRDRVGSHGWVESGPGAGQHHADEPKGDDKQNE